MKQIAVVTFSRSDYSSCLPVLRGLKHDKELDLRLVVAGMHLAPEFGDTYRQIEADGFEIADKVESSLSSDSPAGMAVSLGLSTIELGRCFGRATPDMLLIVGDRLELLSAASAALPFRIPVAHVSGGDTTEGAIDNQVRHAVSKLSHLHFVAMAEHAALLRRMGEEPWRITVTGDPALDELRTTKLMDRPELGAALGLDLAPPVFMIAFHPATLGKSDPAGELSEMLRALADLEATLVFSYPNADSGGRELATRLRSFVRGRERADLFFNLGQERYYSLMAIADIMLGNSSSGIWEAPSFGLPVINIGQRQKGRLCAANVISVPADEHAVGKAIKQCLDPSFRASLKGMRNPYGDGRAVPRILQALKETTVDEKLLNKSYGASDTP